MNEKPKSPMRAIRAKCLDGSGGSSAEAKICPVRECPLFAFRNGRNPYRQKREMSEEQRAKAVERLARARERKGAVQ